MVEIAQVFNNNSALVNLGDHRQAIVKGKGIAFRRTKGNQIDSSKVEKIFYLNTKTAQENLYFLIKDIPIDIVTTTYEIIDYAIKKFDYNVLDYAYITLGDHIFGSYQRILSHTYQESLIPDMSNQYPVEYLISHHALDIIYKNLDIKFPESETKSIALHFINAKGAESQKSDLKEDTTKGINQIVKSILNANKIFRIDANSNYFDRFMIHLQYLAGRLNDSDEDDKEFSENLEREMKNSYPESFKIAKEIYDSLQSQLSVELDSNELLYFIIHIQRLIQEKSN
ncbi:PRD domain-containing protein [Companilactobacillus futsaii]|uniref:PRD domain-containing protein n=2 Tax=Companilactobacillus futsaii TaxID=938155 RepID=A0A5B7T2W4_9LACO|nr:PRD domain-containing protein [Companilactobacillus futsaii]KRK93235.1 transcription antiterminator lacT [Companilactobacillus futsaii JCM 17355]QCX24899.1 PRD domain-containing protein [Companilactobacillus futsaii]